MAPTMTSRCRLPVEKNGDEVKASTSFVVPYQDWGMKNPSTFLLKVENKVSISISSVGRIRSVAAARQSSRSSLRQTTSAADFLVYGFAQREHNHRTAGIAVRDLNLSAMSPDHRVNKSQSQTVSSGMRSLHKTLEGTAAKL